MWRRLGLMKRTLNVFLTGNKQSPSPPQSHRVTRFKMPATMPQVLLTDKEAQLQRLLLDVVKFISDTDHASSPVILRWAGGWVRDKLLGIPSHDIDVAINSMTGMQFAERLRDYCSLPESIKLHKIEEKDIGNLHAVASNPEKSKHLETAIVRIFGLSLDFVNLRKEMYAEDSRNPQVEFGTAEEDALRRDATINSLFYNLQDRKIEDFTGGFDDLNAKLIKTPLEPLQTFMDDPLRVLRLVRFASRLDFSIDPETERYMGNEKVLNTLKVKISRERVGIELEKMLRGNNPCKALCLINQLNLYLAIFTDPCRELIQIPDLSRWSIGYQCLETLIRNKSPKSISDLLIRTPEATYMAWNLAAMSPWMMVEEDCIDRTSSLKKVRTKRRYLVEEIAREGFKATNKITQVIAESKRNREEILKLKRAVNDKEGWINERDTVGMKIRRWDGNTLTWKLQALNCLLLDATEQLSEWKPTGSKEQDEFFKGWQSFLDHLIELEVYDAPSLKLIFDGKMLSKRLGWKPSLWTGKAMEICTAWQLRNPGVTDPAEGIEEVKRRKAELPDYENIKMI